MLPSELGGRECRTYRRALRAMTGILSVRAGFLRNHIAALPLSIAVAVILLVKTRGNTLLLKAVIALCAICIALSYIAIKAIPVGGLWGFGFIGVVLAAAAFVAAATKYDFSARIPTVPLFVMGAVWAFAVGIASYGGASAPGLLALLASLVLPFSFLCGRRNLDKNLGGTQAQKHGNPFLAYCKSDHRKRPVF